MCILRRRLRKCIRVTQTLKESEIRPKKYKYIPRATGEMGFHHSGLDLETTHRNPEPSTGLRTPSSSIKYSNNPESITYKQCQRSPTSMIGHQELRILQYNVQKSRDVVLANLFQDHRILKYDVLVI